MKKCLRFKWKLNGRHTDEVQIGHRKDLMRLCEVSKTLYHFAAPRLHEDFVIQAGDEERLEALVPRPVSFSTSSNKERQPLRSVKSIEVQAPFRKVLDERCIHYRALNDSDVEWDEVGHVVLLGTQQSLRDSQLTSYRYLRS